MFTDEHMAWIRKMRRLMAAKPKGLDLRAMDTTLHVLGPEATALVDKHGDLVLASVHADIQRTCEDFSWVGPITDSGGW